MAQEERPNPVGLPSDEQLPVLIPSIGKCHRLGCRYPKLQVLNRGPVSCHRGLAVRVDPGAGSRWGENCDPTAEMVSAKRMQ